jgi:hypothetical protein
MPLGLQLNTRIPTECIGHATVFTSPSLVNTSNTSRVQQVKTTFLLVSFSLHFVLNSLFLRYVGSGAVHKSGGGRGRSLSVFENSDVDKEVGNALRKVKQQVGTTNSPVAGVLNEPYLTQLSQLSGVAIHCKKKVSGFPVPSRDVTDQTLPGRELLNYSRPGRVW